MTTEEYLRYGIALVVVIALIVAASVLLPRLLHGVNVPRVARRNRRLRVVEMLPIDARRQLVLVRRDNTEHLILLTPERGLVVEAGIRADATAPPPLEEPA